MKKVIAVIAGVAGAAGLAYYLLTRPPVKITTYMEVTTPPPSSVSVGESFTFAGYLKDEDGVGLEGKTVNLVESPGAVALSTTTNSGGGWSFDGLSLDQPGETVSMYAEFLGDEQYAGCS